MKNDDTPRLIPLHRSTASSHDWAVNAWNTVVVLEGRVIPLWEGQRLLVGTNAPGHGLVADPHVSGRHVRLDHWAQGVRVVDLDSTNGCWRQGNRLVEADLEPGDAFLAARTAVLVARQRATTRFRDAATWRGVIARDPASLQVLARVVASAASSASVWVHGESGTGKEAIARALHELSPRRGGPFVALNCAALPADLAEAELFGVVRGAFTGADRDRPGAFQRADGGTLLLDEVGELKADAQAKLLRVLDRGEFQPVGGHRGQQVDVRVVASTWRDLESASQHGLFRFDLLQRLSMLRVNVPPLRERMGDLGPLLEAFLEEVGAQSLWPDKQLLEQLARARWPGNVRELRNRVHRAALTLDPLTLVPTDATGLHRRLPRRGRIGDAAGLARIHGALRRHKGNRAAAARELGISRSTLYRWMSRIPGTGGGGLTRPGPQL